MCGASTRFFTTADPQVLDTVAADKTHRHHAVIEQVHADLKGAALALECPSAIDREPLDNVTPSEVEASRDVRLVGRPIALRIIDRAGTLESAWGPPGPAGVVASSVGARRLPAHRCAGRRRRGGQEGRVRSAERFDVGGQL
jgi:hypothetical protein